MRIFVGPPLFSSAGPQKYRNLLSSVTRPTKITRIFVGRGHENVCRSWEDLNWDGTGRRPKVNAVLGSLCRFYYPGMVELNGERFAAMQWADWGLKDYVQPGESSSGGGSSEQK
jgi:hypothetical protein